MNARKLFYNLPPAWRFAARRLYYFPADAWEALTGQRDELTPPRGLIFTGGGDFRKAGEQLLAYFQKYCGLTPDSHVLDVGSGIGRSAIPLTGFLSENGSYDGFDPVPLGVNWCQANITSRFPNFRFRYVPLGNDLYRSDGPSAVHFQFPYESGRFNLAVVNSVFTHLLPEEVDNYLGEIHRVLVPGGVCYATFFLFDEKTAGNFPPSFDFPHDHGHYRLMDERVKSANVAFEAAFLRSEIERHGFRLRHLFHGSWRGLPKGQCKDFQDLVILEKQ